MTKVRRLASQWYYGLVAASEKEERTQLVLNARPTLDILKRILNRELESLDNQTDFDTPAWEFKLAKNLGKKEAIKDLLKLLTHIEE